MYLKLSYLL